jgi:hypothetical protein
MDYQKLAQWLCSDDTGASSCFMASIAAGSPPRLPHHVNHPYDAEDLGRCIRLVRAVPEVRECFPEIAKASAQWAAIVANWDDLENTYIAETRGNRWGFAPQTSEKMRAIRS